MDTESPTFIDILLETSLRRAGMKIRRKKNVNINPLIY